MNTNYDMKAWAAETTHGRQVFNYCYRLSSSEFKGWKLLKEVTMQEGRDVAEKAYVLRRGTHPERELVRISITERHSWRSAQETLHEQLMHSMHPDIPRGTNKLAQLGDVIFVSRDPETDVPASISFTRGNLCVSVSSAGEQIVDVSKIATDLDKAFSTPPPKRLLVSRRVRTESPKSANVKANKSHCLIKSLQKATPRGKWLKVIVPDGEITRKADTLNYVSAEGGRKKVCTYSAGGD